MRELVDEDCTVRQRRSVRFPTAVLDETLEVWATQPMMGRGREELAPGVRSFAFGKYVVFFSPLPDGIDVVRVLHGARDIEATLSEE